MKRKVFFYNHHQHGDLVLTRGIVNWIVNNFPSDAEFYYSSRKNPDSVYFNDRVKVIGTDNIFTSDHPKDYIERVLFEKYDLSDEKNIEDFIFLNLWIGSSFSFINKRNRIIGANGFPVDFDAESIFEHCIELVYSLRLNGLNLPYPRSIEDIIPKSNFNPKQKNNVDSFLNDIRSFKIKVLVCNGLVESAQSDNFSFKNHMIKLVDEFKDVAFIYTDNDGEFSLNEFCVNNYCELPNLNEIDYLSTYCDILITRRSGPGEIIQTYQNFFNKNKSILSFTYNEINDFIFKGGRARLEWSNDFSKESLCNTIKKHILYYR